MSSSQVEIALKIATKAHENQFRRDGKTPYINHPVAVAKRVAELTRKRRDMRKDYVQAVALLHDVLEDTNTTELDLLEAGVAQEIVKSVKFLTKDSAVDYLGYLTLVSRDPMAKWVKIADMISNISDEPTDKQLSRYAWGLDYLLNRQPHE